MKLSENKVDSLTGQIVRMLQERDDLELRADANRLRALVRQAMLDELLVEDRLEEEVRRILQGYEREIRRGRLSYNTLFNRIKAQLVRERGLVL
ncbi:MAG: DUF507 family protein [Chloroflexia bacterium]